MKRIPADRCRNLSTPETHPALRSAAIFIALLVASRSLADGPPEPSSSDREELDVQREALSLTRLLIEKLKSEDPSVAALKLGQILRKTSRQSIYQVEERWEVHRQAKEALLAMPGHAGYFVEHVKSSGAKAKGGEIDRYDFDRIDLFETFRLLPSAEVVRALGEYLEDDADEPPPVQPWQDYSTTPANSLLAAGSLGRLIDKPPLQKDPRMYGKSDIEPWKLWYAQVKAGTREFKFKGDDKTYRLTGEAPRSPDRPHIPHAEESPTPSPAGNASSAPERTHTEPASSRLPLIASLAVLAAAGVGLLISRRKAKS
ncbi:hypothetical protein [Luteolibacter sp. Populi]|uniref:hypothetical protein n=1 Tax=Luteolibacter sp. Populi TaxID=3230487 RepID=UPI003467554E